MSEVNEMLREIRDNVRDGFLSNEKQHRKMGERLASIEARVGSHERAIASLNVASHDAQTQLATHAGQLRLLRWLVATVVAVGSALAAWFGR